MTSSGRHPIEDIYPLSPMQQGMVFHSLYEPGSRAYHQQSSFLLGGALDPKAFEAAWGRVVQRHAVLRTAFEWEGLEEPVQVVHRTVEPPFGHLDWRGLDRAEQDRRLEDHLRDDLARGFDLSKPPLLRCTLIRLTDDLHRFVWSFHHAILDGWSTPIVMGEVLAFHDAIHANTPLDLPRPRPYRDYIAWLGRQDLQATEAHWRRRLHGFGTPTPLAVDRPAAEGSGDGTGAPGELHIQISQPATQALQALSRQHRVTLNTLVQGAWAILLSRQSGEEDVLFGATTSGRPPGLPGVESMVGLFINTLPVRVQVSPQARLLDWLGDLQARQAEIREHEHSPLARVQRWSEIPPGQALFDSLVVFESYPMGDGAGPAPALRILGMDAAEKTNYPLTLVVGPGIRLTLKFSYDRRRLDQDAAARMLGRLQTLLEAIAGDPDRRLGELPILADAERHRLLVEWNGTHADVSGDGCIHELVEVQAARSPEACAVAFGSQRLTYAALNTRANQLARHLRALGVGPEAIVGVCMERSPEAIVALLGVLKAGGAYLPLDPAYPQERLAFMVEDAGAPVLLTQARLLADLPATKAHVVCLDSQWAASIAHEDGSNLAGLVRPSNLAYVIYTSGSTGKPKGVLVEHASLLNLVAWHNRTYNLGPDDRTAHVAGLGFDASVWEVWPPLAAGASLHLPEEETRSDPRQLRAWLLRHGITVAFVPTPIVEDVIAGAWPPDAPLRHLLTGGDRLARAPPAGLPFRLVNHYGPTESTVVASSAEVVPASEGAPPIGRPIANTRLYVLDRRMEPVPMGVAGELCIGGSGLARGYLNRPDLTADRFVPDPFSGEPGARLYRTGDLARHRADGQLEFLGRLDHQVKIRGYRIELGEVEAALAKHPRLREAVVLAREDAPGQRRLVAYLVPNGEAAPDAAELRDFLKRGLPAHMVPAAFVTLAALPLTRNGKVDRKALPAPEGPGSDRTVFVAPRTGVEETLARLWSGALRVGRVGIHDNFFELGGDSILSIQVASRATAEGIRLTPKAIFQHPTIAELAALAATGPSGAAEQGIVVGAAALTPIQHWFFEQDLPARSHFNQSILLEAPSDVDPGLLGQAFARVLEHHDALRLRFRRGADGAWGQEFAPPEGQAPFAVVDLSATPLQEQSHRIQAEADRIQASLDIEHGPLTRLALFDLGPGRARPLLWVAHHLAVDGVSWRILPQDLETAYLQLAQAKPVVLPPKTTSFRQWSERLAGRARSPGFWPEMDYWRSELMKPVPPLPLDGAGPNAWDCARNVSVQLTEAETRALLQEVPKAYRTQINDALLTALAQAVGQWTGQARLLVNLEGHGREELFDGVDLSRTVGWFTTLSPVVLDLPDPRDCGASLRLMKERLRAVPDRGIGYGILRHLCDPATRREMERLPRAAVSFNYLGQFDPESTSASLFRKSPATAGRDLDPRGTRSDVLGINGAVSQGRLEVAFTYSENLHRRETIERLAQGFAEALRGLIAHCRGAENGGYTPSDFPLADVGQAKLNKALRGQVRRR
jgi:amino acid adenylation domain-containing protein/non-ribosomal peptide synthase protein (TIGR01720 family)